MGTVALTLMHPTPPGPDRPGADDAGHSHDALPASDLIAAVRRLARTSVMVIGDVMLDRTVYGTVERISPEAPIPVLLVDRELAMPGGAGNVVRNLTALGAAVAFVSVVGDDQAGSDLTGLIGGQPGVEPWLLVQGGRATTVKTRFISGGQQLLRSDREETAPIQPKVVERMMRVARDTLAATSVAVLSDYGKGVLSGETAGLLIAAARASGRRVVVGPRGSDYGRYTGADVITPNRRGLAEATGLPAGTEAEISAAAVQLRAAHGFGAVLVTRGEDGMTLADDAGVLHLPAEATEFYDSSGAGDTVLATVAAALASGLDLRVAARLANLAGSVVVGKIGTAVAREEDLLRALSPPGGTLRKIVSRETAVEQVERWRRRGWRIGFTEGRFDMMHPGHVHLLDQARAQCDRLVVGVQRDAAVLRRLGPHEAVQPEAARAAVLAGLPAVDLVCLLDDDSPLDLLEALRPDLLVKGSDHALAGLAGADRVQGWGGRVWLADVLPGYAANPSGPRIAMVGGTG